MTVLAALALLAWAYLLLLHGRFWQAGPVLAPPAVPLADAPPVAVVVPARDEAAGIGACVASLLAQDYPGKLRVIVVDDGSTDGTGDLARAAAGGDARLTVIAGAARPPGWSGKLWAVAQGVEAAGVEAAGVEAAGGAPFLLLTDADIVHAPAHLSALVAQALRGGCVLVSEMVRLSVATRVERALVPAFVYFFQLLYPFARVNDPRARVAAAAGGTMLVRADALAAIGGIAAIRGALIDDVTLAARLKRIGPIWLGHSMLADSRRPYPRAADVWAMVARNAFTQLHHSVPLLAGSMAGMALVWLVPPIAFVVGVATGNGWAALLGLAGWAAAAASIVPTLRRFGIGLGWATALPAVAAFYMAATVGSAVDHFRGRGVAWRGRIYRDGTA